MRASEHRTYWINAFADRVEEKLSIPDLKAWAGDADLRSAISNAFVTIERLRDPATTDRVYATIKEILAQAPEETWNLEYEDYPREPWNVCYTEYAVFAWGTHDKQQLPVGFTIFSIADMDAVDAVDNGRSPPSSLLENIGIHHELIFVRPPYRSRGFGRYLSVGVIEWLARCRVRSPFCAENGVNVSYHADFDSMGGAICAEIITDWFSVQSDLRRDCSDIKRLPWLLASFTEDTGF